MKRTAKKKTRKQAYRELKAHNIALLQQVTAMQKVVWAMVYQEGMSYTIRPDIFDKAHQVQGHWKTVLGEDGSFTIDVQYANETIDGEGKADEVISESEKEHNL